HADHIAISTRWTISSDEGLTTKHPGDPSCFGSHESCMAFRSTRRSARTHCCCHPIERLSSAVWQRTQARHCAVRKQRIEYVPGRGRPRKGLTALPLSHQRSEAAA